MQIVLILIPFKVIGWFLFKSWKSIGNGYNMTSNLPQFVWIEVKTTSEFPLFGYGCHGCVMYSFSVENAYKYIK